MLKARLGLERQHPPLLFDGGSNPMIGAMRASRVEATTPPPLDQETLQRLRRRATRVIFAGVALGTTGLFAAFSLGPLVADDISGSTEAAGLPAAAGVAGVAVGALFLSSIMARRGRGAGLEAGYLLGVLGAVLAVLAVEMLSLWLLLAGMLLIGVAHGGSQLGRFAAADMHAPERRGMVIAWIVWAGTIGALLGPGSLKPLESVARELGLNPLGGGFVAGAVLFAAALVACALGLRPDPRTLAIEDTSFDTSSKMRVLSMMSLPHARAALVVLVAAQVAMLAIMTMTPLHVREGGHGLGSVGLVMSSHFVGMFGLAPIAGKLVVRFGSSRVMTFGAMLLLGGAATAAFTPGTAGGLLSFPLLVLGAGWSVCFVAASALLTSGLSYGERTRLQGSVDGVVWTASALASFGSGPIVAAVGFLGLCLLAAAVLVLTMLWVWSQAGVMEPESI